jgi:hypothetical protein
MDRDEKLQFMAAIIAAGFCADPDTPKHYDAEIAERAVKIALQIEAQGYGGFEPKAEVAKRWAQERASGAK